MFLLEFIWILFFEWKFGFKKKIKNLKKKKRKTK